ncbi:hypothetical protein [Paenibacillus sp. Leaf72]|uniref:hypothetical protein n=1 Tax=Paenibacillus sp. Leaf72 TaxID=1736234 RepID=UPI0006FE4F68|nr:hypothetical protein [Paenibacillus sp. Leaf72]KQN96895.1 hypothetical protein ASF12_22770 [Paenibacillus sp. Leaf72]
MSKEKSILESLAKQVQELKAGVGHMEIDEILGNPNMTAVISVYEGQNPSHKILDAVYEWAETNNEEVAEMIRNLSTAVLE